MKIVRRTLLPVRRRGGPVGGRPARQTFGIGGAAGVVNDVDSDVEFSGFKWGDANGWFEYRMEKTHGAPAHVRLDVDAAVDSRNPS